MIRRLAPLVAVAGLAVPLLGVAPAGAVTATPACPPDQAVRTVLSANPAVAKPNSRVVVRFGAVNCTSKVQTFRLNTRGVPPKACGTPSNMSLGSVTLEPHERDVVAMPTHAPTCKGVYHLSLTAMRRGVKLASSSMTLTVK